MTTVTFTVFCVYGHEHAERQRAEACDRRWDVSWQGSMCPLHDAGLLASCTCEPTRTEALR